MAGLTQWRQDAKRFRNAVQAPVTLTGRPDETPESQKVFVPIETPWRLGVRNLFSSQHSQSDHRCSSRACFA